MTAQKAFATRTATTAVVLAAVLAGCTSGTATRSTAPGSTAAAPSVVPATGLQGIYTRVVRRVLPSVVEIDSNRGLGSGVIYDSAGRIVTNAHVVSDAQHFTVRIAHSSTALSATLVAAYPPDDLAVIQLDNPPADLRPAGFADSDALQTGDIVLAMGSPLGLSGSVTDGIVSATGRTVTEPASSGSPGATLVGMIQTSAAINPGNSGGALVDLSGRVVGIPTLAAVDQQIGGSAPGIGFAIPSSLVSDIAGQIATHGKVVESHRAALGITTVTVADTAGNPVGAGIVDVTPHGPADSAGLQSGDVIVKIDDTTVRTVSDLVTALATMKPGDRVTVTYERQNTSHSVEVTLGELP